MSINPEHKKKPVKENRMRVSLKEMPPKHKKPASIQKKLIAPVKSRPIPKGKQLKKILKKPPIKYKPLKNPLKPTLNKPEKIEKSKPKPKKVDTTLIDPMSWLYEDKSEAIKPEEKKSYSKMGAGGTLLEMKKLYGSEWGNLTRGQQEYMIDNQEIMRRITQSVLTRVASVNLSNNINVNRTNVIEFYLHPNGDMTDFRFLSKSGFFVLDETTKETIEYAYSRYPRPKEKILIRYNVYYNLARY
jgi:periplasmic protein TonB